MQVGSGDNDTILALIRQFHPYEASNHIYIFPKCFLIDRLMMLTPAGCLCRYFVMSFYRIQMICVKSLTTISYRLHLYSENFEFLIPGPQLAVLGEKSRNHN